MITATTMTEAEYSHCLCSLLYEGFLLTIEQGDQEKEKCKLFQS